MTGAVDNLASAIVIGCALGTLVAMLAILFALIRIAEALEKMNVTLALLDKGD